MRTKSYTPHAQVHRVMWGAWPPSHRRWSSPTEGSGEGGLQVLRTAEPRTEWRKGRTLQLRWPGQGFFSTARTERHRLLTWCVYAVSSRKIRLPCSGIVSREPSAQA
jgi:hypothetical protein